MNRPVFTLGLLGTLCFFTLGADSCAKSEVIKPDVDPTAIESNDYTVFIEGCGNQPVSGYTYCRVSEGAVADTSVSLIAPNVICKDAACVFWKIYFPAGQNAIGGSVPKGQTRATIPWKSLINRDHFIAGDRGFWPIQMEIHWTDKDKNEQRTFIEGEIRLRVLTANYVSLSNTKDDPNFVWTFLDGSYVYRMTTGGRAYVGRAK